METVKGYTLSELEPYINGKKFTGEAKSTVRCNADIYKKFMRMINEDPIAKSFLDVYESYKDFYRTEVDFANLIPKEYQMEVFYAAKIGKFYVEVPSFCVYMLNRAYEEVRGIPNLMLKVLPVTVLTEWFKEGYFMGGLTLHDVICNVCNNNYNPLSNINLKNRCDKFTEVYITSEDMVAAVPNSIADELDYISINRIQYSALGLHVDGIYLRTMRGYVGAINSIYDLRKLI